MPPHARYPLATGTDLGVIAIGNHLGVASYQLDRGWQRAHRQEQHQKETQTSFHEKRALNAEIADHSGEVFVSHATQGRGKARMIFARCSRIANFTCAASANLKQGRKYPGFAQTEFGPSGRHKPGKPIEANTALQWAIKPTED
ncbi:hypothetical protein Mrose_01566 [Calidithermus roseus]|uniref:Uncharacterized protein n=1 Tax=Calidithermus roseus TaxID=1644118 RepID=A0A399EQD2_9DEIN|nr:hypothetical protein Mrose_01566 [Calidithermus roseus]